MLSSESESAAALNFDSSQRRGRQEHIVPALRTDEILHTSSTDKHCFLILDDGTRHREPIRLWTDYVLDAAEFHTLKHTPPPKIKVPRPESDSADDQEPLWKTARRKNSSAAWHQPLTALLERKRADEAIH